MNWIFLLVENGSFFLDSHVVVVVVVGYDDDSELLVEKKSQLWIGERISHYKFEMYEENDDNYSVIIMQWWYIAHIINSKVWMNWQTPKKNNNKIFMNHRINGGSRGEHHWIRIPKTKINIRILRQKKQYTEFWINSYCDMWYACVFVNNIIYPNHTNARTEMEFFFCSFSLRYSTIFFSQWKNKTHSSSSSFANHHYKMMNEWKTEEKTKEKKTHYVFNTRNQKNSIHTYTHILVMMINIMMIKIWWSFCSKRDDDSKIGNQSMRIDESFHFWPSGYFCYEWMIQWIYEFEVFLNKKKIRKVIEYIFILMMNLSQQKAKKKINKQKRHAYRK